VTAVVYWNPERYRICVRGGICV